MDFLINAFQWGLFGYGFKVFPVALGKGFEFSNEER